MYMILYAKRSLRKKKKERKKLVATNQLLYIPLKKQKGKEEEKLDLDQPPAATSARDGIA